MIGDIQREKFLSIVDATPLVSIDLVVRNPQQQVLLGKRLNRPALGLWFVPGGRIRKNERIAEAMRRISQVELGHTLTGGKLLGGFDHIYDDNFAGVPGINTHYVVLAFEFQLPAGIAIRPDPQHSELGWWNVEAVRTSHEVHENTRRYFL